MVIVSDICDTLFYSNTTIDFCFYAHKKADRKFRYNILKIIFSRKAPFYYLCALVSRILKFDLLKSILVLTLKGYSRDELYHLADDFVEEYLKGKKILPVFKIINSAEGDRLILISSSIDPVVSAISKSLNADFASSKLSYSKGICTGKIEFEMKGKKLEILKSNFEVPDKWMMISDNLSDLNIMATATVRYAVVYNDRTKKIWENLNAQLIEVNEE